MVACKYIRLNHVHYTVLYLVTGVNHLPTGVKDLPTGGKKVYQQRVNHFGPEMKSNHTFNPGRISIPILHGVNH